MKKTILTLICASLFVGSAFAQEASVDQTSSSVFQKLRSLPSKSVSFGQKLLNFEKAVDYLKGARDCLSGIGCSRRQSYLANYLLGATYGFAQTAAFLAIKNQDPARWKGNLKEGEPGLEHLFTSLSLLVQDLGYRYLVKDKVSLFRCLTFRGCTDQTKRYAFYWLGSVSGRIGAVLALPDLEKAQKAQVQKEIAQWQRGQEINEFNQAQKAFDEALKEYVRIVTNQNYSRDERGSYPYDTKHLRGNLNSARRTAEQDFVEAYDSYKEAIESRLKANLDEPSRKMLNRQLEEFKSGAIEYLKNKNIYRDPILDYGPGGKLFSRGPEGVSELVRMGGP